MNIANALLRTRKDLGYTQTAAADLANITQTYLSLIENGKKVPSMEVIDKLAEIYEVPMAIMMWRAIEEKDIPKKKLQLYRTLKPPIDDLINSCFN